MNQRRSTLGLLAVLLLVGGCTTVGTRLEGIANFDSVDPKTADMYRGAQPTRDGILTLKKMGVRTVIDLRNDPQSWEASACLDAGMTYVNIPTSPLPEDPGQIREFLRTIQT